jgi:hypothetical protein
MRDWQDDGPDPVVEGFAQVIHGKLFEAEEHPGVGAGG